MYQPHQLAFKYLRYYLTAQNSKGHGIHSPFVYRFVREVLNNRAPIEAAAQIEALRKELLHDKRQLTVDDFGAGSVSGMRKQRSISQIAANSLKPPKYARLLYRMVQYFQPEKIIELGTSLGITTAYMASAAQQAQLVTLEGAGNIAAVAAENFRKLSLYNVQSVVGRFDEVLPEILQQIKQIDFAFIDGNHRYTPTMDYFHLLRQHSHHQTVLVFDDIHWSSEMEKAWKDIQQHPDVTLTLDLFFLGIVFMRKEQLQRQHFILRF